MCNVYVDWICVLHIFKNNSARLHLHRMTFYCISSVNGINSVGSCRCSVSSSKLRWCSCQWCVFGVADVDVWPTHTPSSYRFFLRLPRSRIMRCMAFLPFVTRQWQMGGCRHCIKSLFRMPFIFTSIPLSRSLTYIMHPFRINDGNHMSFWFQANSPNNQSTRTFSSLVYLQLIFFYHLLSVGIGDSVREGACNASTPNNVTHHKHSRARKIVYAKNKIFFLNVMFRRLLLWEFSSNALHQPSWTTITVAFLHLLLCCCCCVSLNSSPSTQCSGATAIRFFPLTHIRLKAERKKTKNVC